MKISIHYMGQVRHAAGVSSCQEVDTPGPCTVLECLHQLARRPDDPLRHFLLDENGQVNGSILLFVGEEQVKRPAEVLLRDGDTLTVLSPIAGG